MELLILDFETAWDNEYSLAKMPTMQYIRDPRFRVLGCGFQRLSTPQSAPFFVEGEEEVAKIIPQLPWEFIAAIAHNAQFDGVILSEHYGVRPAWWFDTQLLARWAIAQGHLPPDQTVSLAALASVVGMEKGDTKRATDTGGGVLVDYGINDIRITAELFRFLMEFKPPLEELHYIDLHIRMATEPMLALDKPLLEKTATQTEEQAEVHRLLRKDANFKQILERLGVEIEYKTTPIGRTKPAFAKTDTFMQSLLESDDYDVARYAELRLSAQSNILRTRAQRFLDVGEPFPVPLLYHAAHTGRSGGADKLNLQNLPAKGPLRQSLMAPEGYRLVVGDSSQVEARVVGWLANDEALLETFKASDPYREFGGKYLYQCSPESLTTEQRKVAKSAVLGLGFGQGVNGFMAYCTRQRISVTREEAETAVNAYRQGFSKVPLLWRKLETQVETTGAIELPSGRTLYYPGLSKDEDGDLFYYRHKIFSKARKGERQKVKVWGGFLAENATQATARDLVFWQALQFRKENPQWKIVLLVHDEVVVLAREQDIEYAGERLLFWLRQVPDWGEGLPVDGEVKIGVRYSDCK
jgi:DNA polymerase